MSNNFHPSFRRTGCGSWIRQDMEDQGKPQVRVTTWGNMNDDQMLIYTANVANSPLLMDMRWKGCCQSGVSVDLERPKVVSYFDVNTRGGALQLSPVHFGGNSMHVTFTQTGAGSRPLSVAVPRLVGFRWEILGSPNVRKYELVIRETFSNTGYLSGNWASLTLPLHAARRNFTRQAISTTQDDFVISIAA